MKSLRTTSTYLVLMLVMATALFAQGTKENKALPKYAVMNLVNGINSDNAGLSNSSVYMAGKYGVKETAELLIEKLETEKDSQSKILIALALYKLGSYEGYQAIKELAATDYNPKVRRITNAICDAFEMENGNLAVNMN